MSDIVDSTMRSRMMSGIRAKDTRPEMIIRSGIHRRGYRFRLHAKGLPGKPDLVFKKYRALILINGCFWHGHNCHLFKWPETRVDFWRMKIQGTRKRDKVNLKKYRELEWRVLIVWECALKGKQRHDLEELLNKIEEWLKGDALVSEITGSK